MAEVEASILEAFKKALAWKATRVVLANSRAPETRSRDWILALDFTPGVELEENQTKWVGLDSRIVYNPEIVVSPSDLRPLFVDRHSDPKHGTFAFMERIDHGWPTSLPLRAKSIPEEVYERYGKKEWIPGFATLEEARAHADLDQIFKILWDVADSGRLVLWGISPFVFPAPEKLVLEWAVAGKD